MDGTKVKANASRHKAMSYGHMRKGEAQLKKEIDGLLESTLSSRHHGCRVKPGMTNSFCRPDS